VTDREDREARNLVRRLSNENYAVLIASTYPESRERANEIFDDNFGEIDDSEGTVLDIVLSEPPEILVETVFFQRTETNSRIFKDCLSSFGLPDCNVMMITAEAKYVERVIEWYMNAVNGFDVQNN